MVAEVMMILQIGRGRQQLFDVAEEKIDIEAALVRLVDDDRAVAAQLRIGSGLGEEDAVGHELDPGLRGRLVMETDLVADHIGRFGPSSSLTRPRR